MDDTNALSASLKECRATLARVKAVLRQTHDLRAVQFKSEAMYQAADAAAALLTDLEALPAELSGAADVRLRLLAIIGGERDNWTPALAKALQGIADDIGKLSALPAGMGDEDKALVERLRADNTALRHDLRRVMARRNEYLNSAQPQVELSEGEVERVARAINEARYGPDYPDHLKEPWENEGSLSREYAYRLARATIRAASTRAATGDGITVQCSRCHQAIDLLTIGISCDNCKMYFGPGDPEYPEIKQATGDVAAARNAGLEEAAQIVDGFSDGCFLYPKMRLNISNAIRAALQSAPAPQGVEDE